MCFLILAHLGDETALRVCAALRARHGGNHVRLVSCEELVLAPYWAHRLEDSQVTTEVRLHDGTSLDLANIRVVFNRLLALAAPHFASAKAVDRDYAIQEMNALCLSWLASLPCPVVNPPTPTGLSAPARSHAEWLLLAGRAGLPVQGYHFSTDPRWRHPESNDTSRQSKSETSDSSTCVRTAYVPHRWWPDNPGYGFERVSAPLASRVPTLYLEPVSEGQESVLIAGEAVVGNLAGRYAEPLGRVARLAHCDLLEVVFARAVTGGNWKVCGVNPFPHVRSAEAVEAIVQLLEVKCIVGEK